MFEKSAVLSIQYVISHSDTEQAVKYLVKVQRFGKFIPILAISLGFPKATILYKLLYKEHQLHAEKQKQSLHKLV